MTNGFDGLKVTSFESRRSVEISKLIKYHGGVPRLAPSMKEVPIEESEDVWEFAEDLFNEKIDFVVFLTGVGTRFMSNQIMKKYDREDYINSLKKITIIARGPKPVAALKELELKPDITIPEPNTWKDILNTIDKELDIEGKSVSVQEYGVSNEKFLKGLRERGAIVKPITIYRWGLPDNLGPLTDAIKSISEGEEDLVLFTSSQQVVNLFDVASKNGYKEQLYDGFGNLLVGSIGPTTTETLNSYKISVDYEPNSPKMGNLVREVARVSKDLLKRKRIANSNGIDTKSWRRVEMFWPDEVDDINVKAKSSELLKACRLEKTDFTPIWIMRQAGRYLREYKDIRAKVSFLELCKNSELAAEVTLMAVDRLQVDAAIIFSDILIILEPLGIEIEYSKNDGPLIAKSIRSSKAVESLAEFDPEKLDFVYEAIKITRRALEPTKALIGFAGAPFTVASYAIEGGGSRSYINTKTLMYKDPQVWDLLMEKLTNATVKYLRKQIEAGADVVQIFDSWIGCLSPSDYNDFVLPHMKKLVKNLPVDVPVILFGIGTASLLGKIKETGCRVVGLDWRVELMDTWNELGNEIAVQGNLDPVLLLSSKSEVKKRAKILLDQVNGKPGHIFNLGHGILPTTPVENVLTLVDTVHEYSSKIS